MNLNFNNKKNPSEKATKFKFKKLQTRVYKKHPVIMKIIKKYYELSKPDIDYYYKFSARLRRRHSIEGSKKYIEHKIKPEAKRTKTIIDRKKKFKLLNIQSLDDLEEKITPENMHQNLMEESNYENNELRANFLMNLNPFYTDLSRADRHSEAIIAAIAPYYKGKIFHNNQIIFRYGDELNDFYLVHKGKVNIYCPFTESIYMNIDEYYTYLLRLRKYGEIEMLNNVLLMNNNAFMYNVEDQFNFDKYILKLYNTFIKLKFAPKYLNLKENKKYMNNNNSSNSGFNFRNKNNTENIYLSQKEFNDIIYKSFPDKDMKNLALRLESELNETMIYLYPEEMKQIIWEENEDGEFIKKITKIPLYATEKLRTININEIKNETDYIKRISPIKIFDTNLPRQKVTIMKYILIKTIQNGEYFGEFMIDSNDIFNYSQLKTMKKSKLNLKIHQNDHFYNITAISSEPRFTYVGYIRREFYSQYFKKYVEKMEYGRKKFLLNNRLFKNTTNENLVKTYSKCFKKKILKENQCLINEKDTLTEENTFIYFIVKGEFQSICNQNVESIDKILKALNCEDRIKNTIPIKLNKIKDTFFFEEICKKELKIKLSYLSENDIIGLAENIFKNRYFNSVYCISKEAIVYQVDSRIIKLLVEGNKVIKENKNELLYSKYKVLCDSLLKQRKSYLDSFCTFQIDSVKERETPRNKTSSKKDNILKTKNIFNKIMTSNTAKNSHLKIRNKVLGESENKKIKYTSLSSVCDVLTKVYRGISFEIKRKERSLLFRKNYLLNSKKNKKSKNHSSKELDMTLDLLKEIEDQKTSFMCYKKTNIASMKLLKTQKSSSNLFVRYKLDRNIPLYKQNMNNLILKKNFFVNMNYENKEDNEKNNKDKEYVNYKSNFSDLIPLNYDMLWKKKNEKIKNISSNILIANNFLNNVNKNFNQINTIRLNKLKQIQVNREEMIKNKLRNIYYSDLEKILLSEHYK